MEKLEKENGMEKLMLETLMEQQREYFASGATLPVKVRMEALSRLEKALQKQEQILCKALHTDLGKSKTESVMCEIGLVQGEIRWMKQHLGRVCRTKHVRTPLAQFAAKSYQSPSPYGNVLIMSPWNYPVLLTLEPLVDAIAAGNTAVVKPSAYAPASANALKDLLEECFPPEYVTVVLGGREENQVLLQEKFDKIFFTGSAASWIKRHGWIFRSAISRIQQKS